ncbi:MAG: GTPase ObgE [Candidatus Taylorbacteria bacterium CG10_big_fil_rev_8_21_14_0_10_41_48]|uniref:GTPase Obg n=1 Tax=Candidatus Taylorbacteria bacterium CG10_big_fil_rev_8_21_14_0_10_41_48 TaxID=1975024 RepID=A0A2M8LBA0_9BACT|nr:MAG: GTPase ObgE [Candidatus Taylorbacteria bacterium CG10_big_fil_rev_8_21_14_0_10_41_48]
MAFVDEITFHAKAGKGGDGVVRWLHEKGKEYMGPSGGNGGKGGDVYVEGVRDIGILNSYRNIKIFEAEAGGDGDKKSMDGKTGEDLILKLPVGSIVTNLDTEQSIEILKEGERVLVLKGGRYGLGNEHFKGSTNQRPEMTTDGRVGEEADFHIELRLIVDAGFAGFPNAGKSSLLNTLTNAKAKVANYQFTTLEPNLGDLYGFILADIPGLIEGASEGRGLGDKFLRHIARTKMVLHCISLENEDINLAYQTIRKELEAYSTELASKREIVVLTKTDLVDVDTLATKIAEAKKLNPDVFCVSILNDEEVKQFKDDLVKTLRSL